MIEIPSPNKNIIEEYIKKWDNLEEHYIWQERSLDKLFHEVYKYNKDLNEILIKCSCLNDFYSTNIFLIFHVAKNILEFKNFYNIDKYNLRDIDKYLWIAGKEYFPKKY